MSEITLTDNEREHIIQVSKAMASETRYKIVKLLSQQEHDISRLAEALNQTEANISAQVKQFEKILNAVKLGYKLGLGVNAGHDLTYRNVSRIASIKEIEELNIGHNIIARAVFVGMEKVPLKGSSGSGSKVAVLLEALFILT